MGDAIHQLQSMSDQVKRTHLLDGDEPDEVTYLQEESLDITADVPKGSAYAIKRGLYRRNEPDTEYMEVEVLGTGMSLSEGVTVVIFEDVKTRAMCSCTLDWFMERITYKTARYTEVMGHRFALIAAHRSDI